MHFAFMPYGEEKELQILFRDMQAQKHKLLCYDQEGNEKGFVWVEGALRRLPFGLYEYVVPKESMDLVINSLKDNATEAYKIPKSMLALIKASLKLKSIPITKNKGKYLWIRDNVSIIPVGIREDNTKFYDKNLDCWHEGL